MKKQFKIGDLVIPISGTDSEQFFLEQKEGYRVEDISDNEIYLFDDEADSNWWDGNEFRLAIQNNFDHAFSLIGKTVLFEGKKFKISSVSVWSKFYPTSDKGIQKVIKEHGYCVMVEDEDQDIAVPFAEVSLDGNVIKLSDEYDAVIDGDNVIVGCQTIPIAKVQEILDLHKKLS
jgi:hypothetical protein